MVEYGAAEGFSSFILPPSSFYQRAPIPPPELCIDDGGCKRVPVARRAPQEIAHQNAAAGLQDWPPFCGV